MSADIINLRQARKQKKRKDREAEAEVNRIAFGRTKSEKSLKAAEDEKARRHIDGHKRETDKAGRTDDPPSGDTTA